MSEEKADSALPRSFCVLPWTHFYTRPDGTAMVCCMSGEPMRRDDGEAFNVRRDSLDAIWNGADYKRIRHAMLNGDELKHCKVCHDNERLGRFSRRQFSNDLFLKTMGKGQVDQFFNRLVDPSDPLTAKNPVFFDLRLGNICNLKCRMCWPGYSSQIERDAVAAPWSGGDGKPAVGETIRDWPEARDLVERLKAFSLEAVRIEMIGGESTINEPQLELLRHFVELGIASDVELFVISNLTNAREEAFGLFAAFKNPTIDISLEGAGRTFEYIRFPGRWSAIARNVNTVQRNWPNIRLSVTPTYQAYNILDICDLYDWCLANDISCKTYNMLFMPSFLSVCVLPQEARDVAANRLEAWATARGLDSDFQDGIRGIALYLRDRTQQASPEDAEAFMRYTNDLDASRRQDIRESLPELYELWCRHRPWDHDAFRHYAPARSTPLVTHTGHLSL